MFTRTYIALCPKCNEATPHEDRRLARWITIGIVATLLAFATWMTVGPEHPERRFAALCLAYVCAWLILDRRAKRAGERCTRCRHKAREALRRSLPDPSNSTIDM